MPGLFDKGRETALAFAIRCAGACALGYEIATGIGLSQPLWAAISAIVVSQARLSETRSSLSARIAGTLAGVVISLAVGALGFPLKIPGVFETAIAVALAALVAHRFPRLRVAMWTCPVVLLTAGADSLWAVALRRASEVIIGAAVGFGFHWAEAALIERLEPSDAPRS